MVQLKLAPVITKNLFSKHYLEERLRNLPVWTEEAENERVFKEIKNLYEKEKSLLPTYEEAQLEENFIKPILRILGHTFEVQQPSDRSPLTPDYAFFPDEESRIEAQKNKGKKEFYKKAIAVGDAKSWGTPLDRKSGGRALYDYNNPSFQIDIYLRDTGVAWGILTDGKFWRLYYNSRDKNPVETYYEVDLEAILKSSSTATLADFKYFYLFFRKEAFLKDASGENFLEKVYSEGVDYAKKVSENLKKNVYDALKILAQGFLAWEANNLKPTEETVKKIHENSLIFLYRSLFILYAESRGLLKIYKPGYEDYDIAKIKVAAFYKKTDGSASEYSPGLWIKLKELFKLIDEGSESRKIPKEELYVPPYNGGLFQQDGEYKFLSEKNVGDKYVADVLYLLTFSEEDDKGFIDYSTLEIRHLGSIYEGLLEYKLKIAEEDLVAIREKDKQIWISKSKANGKKIIDEARKGELYLATDRGERKATGSYYTPDYIVKYIVDNTLSLIVEEKLKGAATNEEKIERILSIKVLDPAMGSGHFLVEATNFLANKILQYIPPEKLREEKEIDWAKREVVKRCIYGVDLNPLATELAKLSLWLATISEKHPLSFLDYHLKVGNSLIGAELQKLSKHPEEVKGATPQMFLSDFIDKDVQDKIQTLVNMHVWIAERAQETIKDIKSVEDVYKQLETNPFRQAFVELANLHTSYWLGNKFSKEEYYNALEAFRQFSRDRSKWEKIKEEEYFKKAQEIAKEKNLFHWNLEFPDIFFGGENPGFDAVVGNPPWIALSGPRSDFEQSSEELDYFKMIYQSGEDSIIDTYALFLEKSIMLLNRNARLAYILPDILLLKNYPNIRYHILNHCAILEIIECGQPFQEVSLDTVVIILKPELDKKHRDYNIIRIALGWTDASAIPKRYEIPQSRFQTEPKYKFNIFLSDEATKLKIRLEENSIKLGECWECHEGIHSGNVRAKLFIVTKELDVDKPLIFGREELGRYFLHWGGEYVRYDQNIIDRDKGEYAGLGKENYFTQEKLLIRRTGDRIIAAYDPNGFFVSNNMFVLVRKSDIADNCKNITLKFLLAILNSKLMTEYFRLIQPRKGKLFAELKIEHLNLFPIRRIFFTTPEAERKKLGNELEKLYSQMNFDEILSIVDSYLPKDAHNDYIVAKEKSDVVHDLLGFLAEQMTELNKRKNEEIKGFLVWLESYLGIKVEDLIQKSKLQEYYKYEWNEIAEVLGKNKNRITAFDIVRREPQEKIGNEFNASVIKLKSLLEGITKTDWLIDRIVYKLYRLTNGG